MKRVEVWFDKPFFIGILIKIKRIRTLSVGTLGEWLVFQTSFGFYTNMQDESKMEIPKEDVDKI